MDNWIREYANHVPLDFCQELCQIADQRSKPINEDYRKCTQVYLEPGTMEFVRMNELIKISFELYKSSVDHHSNLNHVNYIELPSVLKYEPAKQDHFDMHVDNWNPESALRQISIIAYLNDVEQGGETVFPLHECTVKPKAGTLLIFPSYMTYPHSALKPISNSKYVCVTWLTFPQPKNKHYWSLPI